MHGGDRALLGSAVVAYNNSPRREGGPTPETMWRVLRPLISRWQNAGTRALVQGKQELSEEDWIAFLEKHTAATRDGVDSKDFCDAVEEKLKPIKAALSDAAMRKQMNQRFNKNRKATGKPMYTLMTGDRVVCANDQYVSKAGGGKFVHQGGDLKQFTVLKVDGGVVEIQQLGTGVITKKHESQLKLMTKIQPPNDSLALGQDVPSDVAEFCQSLVSHKTACLSRAVVWWEGSKWRIVPTKMDGQCFYRCASMHETGILEDSDLQSFMMREKVSEYAKTWFEVTAKGAEKRRRQFNYTLHQSNIAKPTNKETNTKSNKPTHKQPTTQTNNQANKQTNKHTSMTTEAASVANHQ